MNGVNNRLDSTEEMISKLEDTAIETIQNEEKGWGSERTCRSKPVDSVQQPDWSLRRNGKRGVRKEI